MQPQEHRLSQEVLEFLIAHQDWFMLDVTPPPVTGPGTVGLDEELDTILSSDEEGTDGSWRLVGSTKPSKIARRRSTTDKHGRELTTARFVADTQPFSRFPSPRCPHRRDKERWSFASHRGPGKPGAVGRRQHTAEPNTSK